MTNTPNQEEFRTDDLLIRRLNPEQVLRYGYCMHVVDDPHANGSKRQELATDKLATFMALKATPGTPEQAYLEVAHTCALSYAGQIGNLKRNLYTQLEQANAESHAFERRMRGSKSLSILTAATRRYLVQVGLAGVVFAIGYSLAHTLAPFVPEEMANQTGTRSPSILTGFVFVIAGRWLSVWWDERRRSIAKTSYATRCNIAWDYYGERRIATYRHHYSDLRESWKQFTGSDYETDSLLDLHMEDELALRRHQQKLAEDVSRSQIIRLKELVDAFRNWRSAA